jgi:hypothetical protein
MARREAIVRLPFPADLASHGLQNAARDPAAIAALDAWPSPSRAVRVKWPLETFGGAPARLLSPGLSR